MSSIPSCRRASFVQVYHHHPPPLHRCIPHPIPSLKTVRDMWPTEPIGQKGKHSSDRQPPLRPLHIQTKKTCYQKDKG